MYRFYLLLFLYVEMNKIKKKIGENDAHSLLKKKNTKHKTKQKIQNDMKKSAETLNCSSVVKDGIRRVVRDACAVRVVD